jgi:cell wall-associated NlpC family hydrolase
MRFFSIILVLAAMLVVGCTPYPRYRTGTAEKRQQEEISPGRGYSTNDYLRLGSIMRSYLGKPYLGKSRYERGVDCSMFVQEVFGKFDGRSLPRTVAQQWQEGRPIHRKYLAIGDLVFFRTDYKEVSHVGIYTDGNRFMHASTSQGVIISSLLEDYWAKRYIGARRILERRAPETDR